MVPVPKWGPFPELREPTLAKSILISIFSFLLSTSFPIKMFAESDCTLNPKHGTKRVKMDEKVDAQMTWSSCNSIVKRHKGANLPFSSILRGLSEIQKTEEPSLAGWKREDLTPFFPRGPWHLVNPGVKFGCQNIPLLIHIQSTCE